MKKSSHKKTFLLLIFFLMNLCFAQSPNKTLLQDTATIKNFNQTTADTADTTKQVIKKGTLKVISFRNILFNDNETIVNKSSINYEDYRFTGDLFTSLPFGYLNDLGSLGQPSEMMLYGNGFNGISYTENGIPINNRFSNSFDLNNFQSESIDSIEILPLPKSFLTGIINNSAAVNFIARNKIVLHPYSRLRFYQAPNDEGFVDGMFNAFLSSRLKTFFEITNNSTAERFTNSEYGNWKISSRFHYLLSSTTNILLDYTFNKNEVHLNGGVDLEKISANNPQSQINNVLYDNLLAPVNFRNRYMKTSTNNLVLHILNNFGENTPPEEMYECTAMCDFQTNLTLYYRNSLDEFRQNERTDLNYQDDAPEIVHNNNYTSFGGNISQEITNDYISAKVIGSFESTKFTSPLLPLEKTLSSASVSGVVKSNLISQILTPSIFGKYLKYNSGRYAGFGGDITFRIDTLIKFYAGYSWFQKPRSIWEDYLTTQPLNKNKNNISSFEVSAHFNLRNFHVSTGFISQKASNEYQAAILLNDSLKSTNALYFNSAEIERRGINFSFSIKEWKLLLAANTTYYFSKNRNENKLPEIFSSGGIYYIDTLFNNNLELKAGFNYKYYGSRPGFIIDFEKNITASYFITDYSSPANKIFTSEISPFFKLDFFLSGRIQKSAIVYFTFENILDGKYFVVPYYPMYERGLKFGVAWEFLD